MEMLLIGLVFVLTILLCVLLGYHRTPFMKDLKKYKQGVEWVHQKKYEQAIVYFHDISSNHPNSALSYVYLAFCHLQLRNFHQCIHYANQALTLDSNLADAYYYTGLAYFNISEWSNALTAFDKAVWHSCDLNSDAIFYRGVCHLHLENFEKAESDFQKSTKLGHENANQYLLRMKNDSNFKFRT
jgi:tetratricopeptide (TPR) repeat protein